MGTPAFLLCYGFIIADIQGDKPDFQSSQTKKQGDKVYFKPLCGPHRRQNRAKSASYPAPTGTKGTRVPCILGTQARQGCPIPGCNPTPQHAADGGRQARCPVPAPKPNRADPRQQRGGQWQAAEGIQCAKAGPARQKHRPMGCAAPGDLQRKVRGTAHGKQHQLPRRSQTVETNRHTNAPCTVWKNDPVILCHSMCRGRSL